MNRREPMRLHVSRSIAPRAWRLLRTSVPALVAAGRPTRNRRPKLCQRKPPCRFQFAKVTQTSRLLANVLALSKINFNSCLFDDRKPVTIRFAGAMANFVSAPL